MESKQMQKFIETKSNDFKAIDGWFFRCRERKIPYVIIKKRKKYSTVEWDYITYDAEHDDLLKSKTEYLNGEFKRIFSLYSNPKSSMDFSCFLVSCDNILIEDSQKLAEDLYDVVHSVIPGK